MGEAGGGDEFAGADEDFAGSEDLLDAVFCEFELGGAGVATGFCPFGFPWEWGVLVALKTLEDG